jgi:hypothetical protein
MVFGGFSKKGGSELDQKWVKIVAGEFLCSL